MSLRSQPLDDRQLAVLRWVGDGCPDGPLAVPANKNRAQALANRGLVEVKRGKPGWRAVLTEAGRFYRDHGRYPEPPKPEPAKTIDAPVGTGGRRRPGRPRDVTDEPGSVPDSATVRRMARDDPGFNVPAPVAKRLRLKTNVMYKQEVVVRFEVKITRVQVATRYVTATDQEAAAEKIREQLEKPYGFYANFETVGSQIEVVQKEENHAIKPVELDREGPMLISLADAARATGISYSQLGDIAGKGSIEQVRVGSRRYLKRKSLLDFIERNTYRGWAY